jgi:predicted Zn-dependent protease
VVKRLVICAVCAIAVAFLALQLRSVRLEDEAIGLVEAGQPSAADAERAEDLLERAGDGNPTSAPEFRRAQLYAFTERPEEAVELLRAITADEPDHLPAWILLARTADATGDDELAAEARRRMRELNPRAARPER